MRDILNGVMRWGVLLLGVSQRVSRRQYIGWGIGLGGVKVLGEMAMGWLFSPVFFNPMTHWSSLLGLRGRFFMWDSLPTVSNGMLLMLLVWVIFFMWVGGSMSVRRAADAGISPWWGILYFVPFVRMALMLTLCCLPSSPHPQWQHQVAKGDVSWVVWLRLLMILTFLGVLCVGMSVFLLERYGLLLFVGIPLMLGLLLGFYANRQVRMGIRHTLWWGLIVIMMVHLVLWVGAFEGLLCLSMSFPLALVLGCMGSLLGRALAGYSHRHHMGALVMGMAFPFWAWSDYQGLTHRDMVMSQVEIAASPAQVWPHVIQFPELPPPTEWPFQSGIAYPLRARIEGEGVGAVRYCEFSTGPFVEPITVWDQPRRLAFDVVKQPVPLTEWSLYRHVNPPHLDGYFRSVRGEFRLVPLSNGGTRLEGRTWIELDMYPGWYWQLYARWLIHRIHLQVLTHIKTTVEQPIDGSS